VFGNNAFGDASPTGPLSYGASLERRLGGRTWLALNARLSYQSDESTGLASSSPTTTYRLDTTSTAVLLGLRYVFARGVVDASFFGAAFAGYRHTSGDRLHASGSTGIFSILPDRYVGVLAGVAVERELIEALALRLSLNLATAQYGWREALKLDENDNEQRIPLSSGSVGFTIVPGIELHFYF
jgi:hypothetical protein